MTKKEKLLQQINDAFAKNNTDFIVENVSDNIKWTVIGDFSVEGKEAFTKALKEMEGDEPFELHIDHIITHGEHAAVNGVMTSAEGEQYAFCDVYKLSGFKNPKISEITSYVIQEVEN